MRRDELRDGDKVNSHTSPRAEFVAGAQALLDDIQARLFAEAKARLDGNITSNIKTFDELAEYFGAVEADDEGGRLQGLGARRLVEAGGRRARGDRGPAEGSEAYDPQRARWTRNQ